MEQPKISFRTQVLLTIHDFQTEYGHGIQFNQLHKRSGLDRVIVSKSFDSLMDMGMIEDQWMLENCKWNKVIRIPSIQLDFVTRIRNEIEVASNE